MVWIETRFTNIVDNESNFDHDNLSEDKETLTFVVVALNHP